MSASSSGARRITALTKPAALNSTICRSCQATPLRRRHYASSAAAAIAEESPSSSSQPSSPSPAAASPALQPSYTIRAGILLSRAPQLTRPLSPFEKAFYFYQRRLNERLALPFTRYFYFKRGTPTDVEWKRKFKDRQTAARDIGRYNAYSEEAWNDELLVGARESEPEAQVEALVRDAGEGAAAIEGPPPRETEADRKWDRRSLNRLLQRTLYLVVRSREGGWWGFPSVVLGGKENLRQGAERSLAEAAGVNVNIWIVGYHPIGHYVYNNRKPKVDEERGVRLAGEKTFFLKGRIMAGQADLRENQLGLEDFMWLAKEEIEETVPARFWGSVRNMLADR